MQGRQLTDLASEGSFHKGLHSLHHSVRTGIGSHSAKQRPPRPIPTAMNKLQSAAFGTEAGWRDHDPLHSRHLLERCHPGLRLKLGSEGKRNVSCAVQSGGVEPKTSKANMLQSPHRRSVSYTCLKTEPDRAHPAENLEPRRTGVPELRVTWRGLQKDFGTCHWHDMKF